MRLSILLFDNHINRLSRILLTTKPGIGGVQKGNLNSGLIPVNKYYHAGTALEKTKGFLRKYGDNGHLGTNCGN
ncbi:unnamed protein product [Allacma fusca]|uniref:Uncharacterized protein n=1 Tax=Allacma fusca TaxID=39272 RepID=A0A8J2K370_9HEXA|nr:unnamed protein product [Allacma fusca]